LHIHASLQNLIHIEYVVYNWYDAGDSLEEWSCKRCYASVYKQSFLGHPETPREPWQLNPSERSWRLFSEHQQAEAVEER
jgi:hypothetical protein